MTNASFFLGLSILLLAFVFITLYLVFKSQFNDEISFKVTGRVVNLTSDDNNVSWGYSSVVNYATIQNDLGVVDIFAVTPMLSLNLIKGKKYEFTISNDTIYYAELIVEEPKRENE